MFICSFPKTLSEPHEKKMWQPFVENYQDRFQEDFVSTNKSVLLSEFDKANKARAQNAGYSQPVEESCNSNRNNG